MSDNEITLRLAGPRDWEPIAELHVRVSQASYAHILSAGYLRDELPGEKRTLWQGRLEHGADLQRILPLVAESAGRLAGFICFDFEQQPEWGVYLHNIYVDAGWQRRGIARRLVATALESLPSHLLERPVHLLALAQNRPACAVYERWRGRVVEERQVERRDNSPIPVRRYQWASCAALAAGLGADATAMGAAEVSSTES